MHLLDKKVKDMTIEDFREDMKRIKIQKSKLEKLGKAYAKKDN